MGYGNDSKTGNYSGDYYKFMVDKHLPYVLLTILVVLVNSVVILLFALKKSLRKPPNYLLMSLSVSDLLTGLFGPPLALVCSTTPDCASCIFSHSFVIFTSVSTVLHLLAVSYERFIKIVFPFRLQQIGTMAFVVKLIVIMWGISVVIALLPLSWYPPVERTCLVQDKDANDKARMFNISLITFFLGLPVLLMIFADVSVFLVFRRQLSEIDKTSVGLRDAHKRIKKECKVMAMITLMMVYFVLCWSFYYTSMIYETLEKEPDVPMWFVEAANIIRCTTSLLNPILYVFLKHDFRKVVFAEIKRLKKAGKKRKDEGSAGSSRELATLGQSNSRNNTQGTTCLSVIPEPQRLVKNHGGSCVHLNVTSDNR